MSKSTAKTTTSEPEVTKRKVTMTHALNGGTGFVTDYVRPDILDAYLADARTRWGTVEVSDEPDAGPGGYHGQTYVPEALDHPLAGQTFPATGE